MKYLLISLVFSVFFGVQNAPVIEWTTPVDHDLGDIALKKPVTVLFQYKNVSDKPLAIDNVRPTCGCTAPDWSPDPIAPDSVGTIKIVYDATHPGYFRKKVKVFFDSQKEAERLYIEGFVAEK